MYGDKKKLSGARRQQWGKTLQGVMKYRLGKGSGVLWWTACP